ncbi:MAG TPA: sugar kinase [Cyclobacteriaceae bacterium]|nr:sugar kinase [Cyclobacteriaceae bacterium]
MSFENIIVVTGKTRLEQLVERFNTYDQAKFYIEHSGSDFSEYEQEHETFKRSLDSILRIGSSRARMKTIDRSFLPNFIFTERDIVVAIGQDGLVANTAKYSKGQPLLGVNPDPQRNDGILLPLSVNSFEKTLIDVLGNKYTSRQVTMAQAITNDAQSLLAFNDLFIGPSSHTSARYCIRFSNKSEEQSSSGIIVSTGAGSTGWLSSVINMSNGVASAFQSRNANVTMKMNWEDDRLVYVVREPFASRHSQINLTAGIISDNTTLKIESHMPFNGVIFSDGIENDYLKFNAGCEVTISRAPMKANLVQP